MIHVLTGPVHSGKTTFLRGMACAQKELGVLVNGYLSVAVRERGKTLGYDLFDLKNESVTPFLRDRGEKDWQRTGPYYLLPDGLAKAEGILLRKEKADLLIVDEVGPLEMKGRGIWPAMQQVFCLPKINCLIVVRENILQHFMRKMGDRKMDVCYLEDREILARINRDSPPSDTGSRGG